jgi:hypothetical protein
MQGDGDGVTDEDRENLHKRTKDWKKKNAAWNQLSSCADGLNALTPQCTGPKNAEKPLMPVTAKYEFIWPWELNRLDALGIHLNATYCFVFACADISFDLIGNFYSNEVTLFATPAVGVGLGIGGDISGGVIAAYDAPYNADLAGAGRNLSANYTQGVGGQATYGVSASPNVTGNYAQTYSVAVSGGGEASGVYEASNSYPIFSCDKKSCYFGVK